MYSWKNYSAAKKLEYFHKNEEDCAFLVGKDGKEEPRLFKSFKFILMSVSPVFERMFNGSFKEATSSEPVKITDIYADDFEVFLQFVYGEKPYVSNWKKLHDIAKKYMAEDVVKLIYHEVKHMKKTPLEALQLFEITYCENQSLKIPNDSNTLTETARALIEAFDTQCSYMFCMECDAFLKLIGTVKSHVPVTKLFQAINNYCSYERNFFTPTHKLHLVRLFLSQVDYTKMTVEEYMKYVEPADILDINAKHKILVDLCRDCLKEDNTKYNYRKNF